jgi:predicted DNA-binding transcriptional regulator YafY
MNINRLRPVGVARENLDVWLSSVILDAMRDATEAGMSDEDAHRLVRVISELTSRGETLTPEQLASARGALLPQEPISFDYSNHRGERGFRKVLPFRLWFGVTEFHPAPQWFLRAWDFNRNAMRDFAITSIYGWGSAS